MTSSNDAAANLISQSSDVAGDGNFFQGCSFSPDGLCVLTSTAADGKLRLYNTVFEKKENVVQNWKSALEMFSGDVVRSYEWYPQMSSQNPTSCCFVASSRDQPAHLYDAYTGAIRATYRAFNALDEMESPTVVSFSVDGQRILCGGFRTDRVIHMFDVAVPGRESTILRLGKTRRSTDGQKGLVSAIASTHDARYFCVGTYSPGSIYIYDDRAGNFPNNTIMNGLCVVGHGRSHSRKKRRFVDVEEPDDSGNKTGDNDNFLHQAKSKWFQTRAQGGVTQLKFAPNQDFLLYSSSRRSDTILLWDLRMLSGEGGTTSPIRGIGSFRTVSDTNQRLQFDLSDDGTTLYAGGMDRCVRIYDTQTGKLLSKLDGLDDATNGVSFTRLSNQSSYLAVATGSRRFVDEYESDEDECSMETIQVPGHLRLYKLEAGNKEASTTTAQDE
eukprot:scaffold15034_cov181-Amphora_coffeaeformis.AAC.13